MAGQPNPNPNTNANTDLFAAYFKRADLDGDGQISGAEAVAFFQGSGLPKNVLAQVWMHADQRKAGYLGQQEFYNALKLVTVAQSKRELTPEIVKAALYGPASAKIPAPQINLAATPSPRVTVLSQLPASASAVSQSAGLRPPQTPSGYVGPRAQYMPSQQGQVMRPPQGMPPNAPIQGFPSQGITQKTTSAAPRPPSSGLQNDLHGASIVSPTSQAPNRGISPSASQDGFGLTVPGLLPSTQQRPQVTSAQVPSTPLKPQTAVMDSNQGQAKGSEAGVSTGNGFPSDSLFGDVFSATPAQTIKNAMQVTSSGTTSVVSSAGGPSTISPQHLAQGATPQRPVSGQSTGRFNLQAAQGVAAASSAISAVGAESSIASQSQTSWPKMTQSDIQNYIKVFMQVDLDKDGKITGEQARNLFLSWRLPREILKQVWDLSDQDNDSMLSLMEFCIALYLMERFREGRPIPASLPKSVLSDETLLFAVSHPTGSYGSGVWGPATGPRQPQIPAGIRAIPAGAAKPPRPPIASQADERQPIQQKPKVPILEKHLVDQLSKEEQDALGAKFQEASLADKKVEELEKEISDSRQKIEFYRAKMQELILYKSRCDNRLNEVSARVSSDKREVEALAKKYEEKYKQAGNVASKLSLEEATFRDIQEKKLELYRAIVKVEADGTSDNVLKERAESIQLSLEEVVKTMNERCKQYGLRAKPTSLVELPFGWQPGVQEGAADWDEDWDKFEDEGFTFVKELTLDVQNVVATPKPKVTLAQREAASTEGGLSKAEVDQEKLQSPKEKASEKNSVPHQGENGETRSPHDSPSRKTMEENESDEHQNSPFKEKSGADSSSHDEQNHSQASLAESVVSFDKSVDEPEWGTFDSHFDREALWGFDSISGKDQDRDKRSESSLLGFDDFGLNPIKTGSSKTDSMGKSTSIFADSVPSTPAYYQGTSSFNFDSVPSTPAYNQGMGSLNFDSVPCTPAYNQEKSAFNFDSIPNTPVYNQGKSSFFDSVPSTPAYNQGKSSFFDSVPSTPAYNQGNSSYTFADSVPSTPAYNFGNSDSAFDSFSRFDSFNAQDGGSFQSPRHSLSKFDSFRSTGGSEQNYGFLSGFDSFRESRDTDQGHGFSTFDSFGDSDPNRGFSRFDSFRDTEQSQGFPARFDSFRESTDSNRTGGFSRFDSFKDNDSGFSQAPNNSFSRFDSFRSDSGSAQGFPSFDNHDPFGSSGPFRTSGETPRKSSDDNWRMFQ